VHRVSEPPRKGTHCCPINVYSPFFIWYTLVYVISCSLRTTKLISDSQLPIQGALGVEHKSISIGRIVNDMMIGIIFYGPIRT
jgi:hypothetical protein